MKLLALLALLMAGCVTPGPLPPPDNEADYAQAAQEAATFDRLAHSNSNDIAQSANALRRPQ